MIERYFFAVASWSKMWYEPKKNRNIENVLFCGETSREAKTAKSVA